MCFCFVQGRTCLGLGSILLALNEELFFFSCEIVLVKNISLYPWEKCGSELPIELAEVLENESENGLHVVSTSACVWCRCLVSGTHMRKFLKSGISEVCFI